MPGSVSALVRRHFKSFVCRFCYNFSNLRFRQSQAHVVIVCLKHVAICLLQGKFWKVGCWNDWKRLKWLLDHLTNHFTALSPSGYSGWRTATPSCRSIATESSLNTANLCTSTKILDFRGFDSSTILIWRGGIPRSIGQFPESSSQGILVGIILVERLGVPCFCPPILSRWPIRRRDSFFARVSAHGRTALDICPPVVLDFDFAWVNMIGGVLQENKITINSNKTTNTWLVESLERAPGTQWELERAASEAGLGKAPEASDEGPRVRETRRLGFGSLTALGSWRSYD